jgi:tol-pal system protein YbgF
MKNIIIICLLLLNSFNLSIYAESYIDPNNIVDEDPFEAVENSSKSNDSSKTQIRSIDRRLENLESKISSIIKSYEDRIKNMETKIKEQDLKLKDLSSKFNKIISDKKPKESQVKKQDEAQASRVETKQEDSSQKEQSTIGNLEQNEYAQALEYYKAGKFKDAENAFANFIKKYPSSLVGSNAYYWYGETFFQTQNYEKAALNYLKGYKKYPTGSKASDSLLKLSLSLGEIGKSQEACATLTRLKKEFPNRSAQSLKRSEDARLKFGCKQ